MPSLEELLSRECHQLSGTKVINCVMHLPAPLTDRPPGCHLCSVDVQNRLRDCIAVNEWLNQWKQDAIAYLRARQVADERPDAFPRRNPDA